MTANVPKYPFRAEIEQILLTHQRTRYAKVLNGMKRGLTDAEMSQEADAAGEPCNADSIAYVRRLVRLTLADERVPAPSDAEGQAGIYRELLNYRPSDELRQHTMARLTQLQQLDPSVKLTPLGDGYLGAKSAPTPGKPPCYRELGLASDVSQPSALP